MFSFFFNLIFTKSDLLFYFVFFFSQPLLETFFYLFDRDSSGLLSESEWIGSVYKVAEYVYMIFSFILSQQTFDHTYIYMYLQDIQSYKRCSNAWTIYTCLSTYFPWTWCTFNRWFLYIIWRYISISFIYINNIIVNIFFSFYSY